jgi:hypothetical protein
MTTIDLSDFEIVTGGFLLERTDEHIIEVVEMIYNWRLVISLPELHGLVYEKGYCYFGRGPEPLTRAILAAQQWRDPLNTDPVGFDKRAF